MKVNQGNNHRRGRGDMRQDQFEGRGRPYDQGDESQDQGDYGPEPSRGWENSRARESSVGGWRRNEGYDNSSQRGGAGRYANQPDRGSYGRGGQYQGQNYGREMYADEGNERYGQETDDSSWPRRGSYRMGNDQELNRAQEDREDSSWGANWYDTGMREDRPSRYYQGRADTGGGRQSSWRGNSGGSGMDGWSTTGSNRQMGRGAHAGKGPKGRSRSDDQIREDVNMALAQDGDVDASNCEISVRGGEVTLTGSVQDKRMKRLCEECVEGVFGVKDVQNQLRVKKSDDASMEQADGDDRDIDRMNQGKTKNKTGAGASTTA